jgi:maleylacetoacetate isomerase
MELYSYWRSSAAYRVRIALALKGLAVDLHPVHLLQDGGQQRRAEYQALNPAQLVPTLVDNELVLNQSLAILDYLEACYPEPALLPQELSLAVQVRAVTLDIACDIHPLNNLRVLQYLTGPLQLTEQQKLHWILHWLQLGFQALEQRLSQQAGTCCFGNQVTWADICLVPQIYNALRFGLDMSPYPTLNRIYRYCIELPAFIIAAPEQQADAQK